MMYYALNLGCYPDLLGIVLLYVLSQVNYYYSLSEAPWCGGLNLWSALGGLQMWLLA